MQAMHSLEVCRSSSVQHTMTKVEFYAESIRIDMWKNAYEDLPKMYNKQHICKTRRETKDGHSFKPSMEVLTFSL